MAVKVLSAFRVTGALHLNGRRPAAALLEATDESSALAEGRKACSCGAVILNHCLSGTGLGSWAGALFCDGRNGVLSDLLRPRKKKGFLLNHGRPVRSHLIIYLEFLDNS